MRRSSVRMGKEGKAMSEKKLYRSDSNRVICGVCGGIAEYFEVDPTLVRTVWAVVSAFGGAGLVAYVAAAIIMPKRP